MNNDIHMYMFYECFEENSRIHFWSLNPCINKTLWRMLQIRNMRYEWLGPNNNIKHSEDYIAFLDVEDFCN